MTITKDSRLVVLTGRPPGIRMMKPDGSDVRTLVPNCGGTPDGVAFDRARGLIYWTNMGEDYAADDGFIERIDLNGSNRAVVVPQGVTFTPKQIVFDAGTDMLYWADREGMRLMRAKSDGSEVRVLVQTGHSAADRADERLHCVGVALDKANGHIYWTQKGPPNAGKGRIFRAAIDLPAGESPNARSDITTIFQDLPEPIDLEIDHTSGLLYWTDRGDAPRGNTLNRAKINSAGCSDPEILLAGLQEGIGLALDLAGNRVFVTDLGGFIRVIDVRSLEQTSIIPCDVPLTGIAYVTLTDS